eukprot:3382116-Amphidinium_carterae.1
MMMSAIGEAHGRHMTIKFEVTFEDKAEPLRLCATSSMKRGCMSFPRSIRVKSLIEKGTPPGAAIAPAAA